MNRALALLLAALALLLPGGGALAQSGVRVVSHVSWVEEWDPVRGVWVPVADGAAPYAPAGPAAAAAAAAAALPFEARAGSPAIIEQEPVRFIAAPLRTGTAAGTARFGPFRVIDSRRAAIVDATDADSPRAFAAMLAAYPGLEVIEFADAPGTSHDLANLRLGRAIRNAGLATHVPAGGSARSGAVELFLAGTRRTIDPGALFAVHSWRDELGREPADFAPDAPENRLYLDYYAEMGMTPEQARAFYAMTNSVPHAGALWLEGAQMARWIAPAAEPIDHPPASRALPRQVEAFVRLAIARSGKALAGAARGPWALPRGLVLPQLAFPQAAPETISPTPAPRLAYADLGAALLDSGAAFP